MVKLSIAIHDALDVPDWWDGDPDHAGATNCWFDVEIDPQDLLDIGEDNWDGMSKLFEQCFYESNHYYRITEDETEVTVTDDETPHPEVGLDNYEWHGEVDWDNGHYLTIHGAGFALPMMDDKLITYLKSLVEK